MFDGLGVLIVAVLVFILCREIWCWYWKINEVVGLLQGIHEELKILNRKA